MPNEMMTKFFPTESDMAEFAVRLAKAAAAEAVNAPEKNAIIIFLSGPLGAGKTTLTRGFLRGLGYHQKVKSPTYTLIESYEIENIKIFHFDFYRIKDAKELEYLGIQDYFFAYEAICLIEWPEKGSSLLPPSDLSCYIAVKEQGREIRLVSHSKRGENILQLVKG